MSNTYTLKAINEFTCIGADCESSCCKRDWDIEVTPEIQAHWERIENPDLRSKILNNIKVGTKGGTTVSIFASGANSDCALLDKQGKCEIHAKLGPELQPNICRSYPRKTYKSATTTIKSAFMSCPEIARLVVENSADDIFVECVNVDADLNQIGAGDNSLENYLDKWAHLVLQDNDASISEKLYYIGKVISDINKYAENGKLTEKIVTEICSEYKDRLRILAKEISKKGLTPDQTGLAWFGWFWDFIYTFSSETFSEISNIYDLTDPIAPLNIPKEKKSEEDFRRLHLEIKNILTETRPLFIELTPGLNRYLSTLFVNTGFPWNPVGGNFFTSYIKSVFHFVSTWYLLAIIGKVKGSLNTQDLARVIYHIESDYSHDPFIADTMKKNPALFDIDNYIGGLLDLNY